MTALARFKLPDGFGSEQIDDLLVERFDFLSEEPLAQTWRIYDTFDWRLYAEGLTMHWSGEALVLRKTTDGEVLFNLPCSVPPRFARELPGSVFRAQLADIIEMRALLELAVIHTWSRNYRILNKDEKTVVRLLATEAQLANGDGAAANTTYLMVRPLRGYGKQASRISEFLRNRPEISPARQDIHIWSLRAAGHVPGSYSGKLDVKLRPSMKAEKATRLILRNLLATMKANEDGVKADIDTEFLHDYRIAIRRTRSALNQIQKVFPADITRHFKTEFKAQGQLTNELRDLDVYLLAEADYRQMLPDAMQEDITPLFDNLRSRRATALAKVVAGLESEAHARFLEEWDAFLKDPAAENDAKNAAVPIINLARRRITRHYRSIISEGNYILELTDGQSTSSTQDELLHALRIECKKLRYLMEFFSSLFSRKKTSKMIAQLKRLQNNLGEFSDLTMQQGYLLSIAESLDIDETRAKRTLVATGYLVESLERRRQEVKAEFAGTFKKFASKAHQKQFHKLFAKRKKNKS